MGAAVVVVLLGAIAYAVSRRERRPKLPEHSSGGGPPAEGYYRGPPPSVDLTPAQAPVQQIVIREVAKVRCKYCGDLIDTTAQVCPRCGAPNK